MIDISGNQATCGIFKLHSLLQKKISNQIGLVFFVLPTESTTVNGNCCIRARDRGEEAQYISYVLAELAVCDLARYQVKLSETTKNSNERELDLHRHKYLGNSLFGGMHSRWTVNFATN